MHGCKRTLHDSMSTRIGFKLKEYDGVADKKYGVSPLH